MQEQEKIRIGIIGIGIMGSSHIRDVISLSNTELIALCDNDPKVVDRLRSEHEVPVFLDYQDLLAVEGLDAIIISTPHYDHPGIAMAAFDKGIHVLVEKPIAVHVNDAIKSIEAYQSALKTYPNLVFAAMFMQRTYGFWRKIKEMIDNGDLGQLIRTTWIITDWFRTQAYYDNGGWRATWKGEGGGVLLNQCPHNLDLYQWLVGMPARVRGFVTFAKHHHIEVEDEVTAYFEHDGGMVGHFITTTGESPGTNRLEIVGENGKLVYENGELVFYKNEISSKKQIAEAKGGFDKVDFTKMTVAYEHHGQPGHRHVIDNFAEAILYDAPLIARAPEGINSVMIGNSIIMSSQHNQTIEMPIDTNAYEGLLQQLIAESTK